MEHPLLVNIDSAWEKAVGFQVEDAQFAAVNNSVVLGHETGLGKTFVSLLAWSQWPAARKAVILGTLGSMATWWRLLRQWGGVQPVFIQGNNQGVWQQAIQAKEGVWMCTYMTYLYLMRGTIRGKPHFDVVVNDELHRVMRHRNQTWKAIKRLDFDHYLGLSATWASRGPQDLFPVLNLVNHRTFSSYWRFVKTWCYVEESSWGTEIFGVRNPQNLSRMLWSQYYRARTWPEVGSQFREGVDASKSPVVRRKEPVPMSRQQQKILDDLDRDMIAVLNNEMIVTPNSLALLIRKLQVAISPKILMPSADYGGPIEWVANKVADDPHTVVFCPFREGLDVLRQKLIGDKRSPEDIFIIRGGMGPVEVNTVTEQWKKRKGVALVTIAFAQSFPLDTTNTAYMLGFDWDPNNNYQAEGRLRRLDSELQTPCCVSYIIPYGSDYHNVEAVVEGKIMDTRGYLQGYAQNVVPINLRDIPLEEDVERLDGENE